jgi:hypothetical protein
MAELMFWFSFWISGDDDDVVRKPIGTDDFMVTGTVSDAVFSALALDDLISSYLGKDISNSLIASVNSIVGPKIKNNSVQTFKITIWQLYVKTYHWSQNPLG